MCYIKEHLLMCYIQGSLMIYKTAIPILWSSTIASAQIKQDIFRK